MSDVLPAIALLVFLGLGFMKACVESDALEATMPGPDCVYNSTRMSVAEPGWMCPDADGGMP